MLSRTRDEARRIAAKLYHYRPFHFLPECAPMTEGTGPAEYRGMMPLPTRCGRWRAMPDGRGSLCGF
jgi:hypothetical protein